ncbi:ImmA/IrrE family metallo-endopeptidase [Brevibacillus centrosporus]|uniref:ImmA/IrrE family metallo-endopeptidase n=1 Tax=Brevibacillus centrosporus TaxID=54910 RepID=UPI001477342B|nr:ImmA/IrrE family metallo-endopeptidase [Brevibacillus centrosporus]MEC2133489.1 ImmA/IrrE family metallo-endopeptidase [Brevibacillus centrosporus]
MDIARRTKNLVNKYRTNCPFKLAKILNITILYLDLPDGVKGYCQRAFRRKFIVLDQKLTEDEQLFVCAHELGHLLFHKGISHYFIEQRTYFVVGKYERQANRFAALLLSHGDEIGPGDTAASVCQRNKIPLEMQHFLSLNL